MPLSLFTTASERSANPAPPERETAWFPRSPRLRRWLRVLLSVIVLCVAVDYSLSLSLEFGWLHHVLTRKLEAAFGRPVEVSHYSFSLLEGPRLEADYITVAEDPRFGNEYFLRADSLAIGLRWSALLRSHIEFGQLSLTRPRLNLVRLPNGEWNLESWLPRPRGDFPTVPAPGRASARLERIEVSDGRVDFKQGPDKLPFAFANVQGNVEQVSPGSWRIALEARPFRAAVAVQQAGVISVSGLVGGTSSRLRPAAFELDWNDASLSDVLRLLRGQDYGVRGLFSLQLAARTAGNDWKFSSRAQFRRLHRWDLPLRADDPAANLNIEARWVPGESHFELTQAVFETPRSNLHATGAVDWTSSGNSMQAAVKNAQLEIISRGVEMTDALTWYRALHAGVAEQLVLNGTTALNLTLSGWPLRIQKGVASSDGVELDGGSARVPIRLSHASLLFSNGFVSLPPATFSIGAGSGEFRIQGFAQRTPQWHSAWKLDGRATEVRSLFAAAGALGFNLPPGWLIDGPAQFHLQWQGARLPALRHPQGTITLAGLKIRAPFLNREITHVAGAVNLSAGDVKIRLNSADAFAATWRGNLERRAPDAEWQFALSANGLNAAEMDRWLNPQRRESFLDRVLPFWAAKPQPQPALSWLRGRGSVSLGEFALAPLRLGQFRANASVEGRKVELSNAQAEFYGGELRGSIVLNLAAQPAYEVRAKFRGVNLSLLAASTFSLDELFGGSASGDLQISAKGAGRDALLHSLVCRGDANVSNAEYKGIDLNESLRAGSRRPGNTSFPSAAAEFSCGGGQVRFSRLQLQSPEAAFNATGYVDFNRQMNFEFRLLAAGAVASLAPVSDPPGENPRGAFALTGALKSPALTRLPQRASPH